jgi:hypothetical protein
MLKTRISDFLFETEKLAVERPHVVTRLGPFILI